VWKKKILTLCRDCSTITKISVYYQHCFSHNPNTASYRLLGRKLTSSQPDTVQYGRKNRKAQNENST